MSPNHNVYIYQGPPTNKAAYLFKYAKGYVHSLYPPRSAVCGPIVTYSFLDATQCQVGSIRFLHTLHVRYCEPSDVMELNQLTRNSFQNGVSPSQVRICKGLCLSGFATMLHLPSGSASASCTSPRAIPVDRWTILGTF